MIQSAKASQKCLRMRSKPCILAVLGALVFHLGAAGPGWGKFGISKTHAVYRMDFPPAFHVPGRELRLHFVSDTMGREADLAERMEQHVGEALTQQNFRLSPSAPTVLHASLNEARASVERERRRINLNVRTGERVEKDKNGKEKKVEECKSQQVYATFLTSRGKLVLSLALEESAARTTLFAHTIERSYLVESMVDGPRLCDNRTYSVSPGHLRYRSEILALLADQATLELIRLASGYTEDRTALLAVDDELKPGNALALAGNWPQAQAAWENAEIGSGEDKKEAARAHNIGVAWEVLAVQAMGEDRLAEAESLLNDADRSFTRALALDSGEKYFREPSERIQVARSVLEKMKEYRTLDQAAVGDLVPVSVPDAPVAANDASLDELPDNEEAPVRDYRLYVRAHLEARQAEPDAAFRKKMLAAAPDYRVSEAAAVQVMESETQRYRALAGNMQKYAEDYQAVAADGTITASEREMLETRRKTLHLTEAMARALEARYSMR